MILQSRPVYKLTFRLIYNNNNNNNNNNSIKSEHTSYLSLFYSDLARLLNIQNVDKLIIVKGRFLNFN